MKEMEAYFAAVKNFHENSSVSNQDTTIQSTTRKASSGSRWSAKVSTPSKATDTIRETPVPGALQDFDDVVDASFIPDSDGELEDGDASAFELSSSHVEEEAEKRTRIRAPYDLSTIPIDVDLLHRTVYVSNISGRVDEMEFARIFEPFGVETSKSTLMPSTTLFFCQRTHRPRGDGRVVFENADNARRAVDEVNEKGIRNAFLRVRLMDKHTWRILHVQHDMARTTWTCPNVKCLVEVSVWVPRCHECHRMRLFSPSGVEITPSDWLCGVCLSANKRTASVCGSCAVPAP